jgi:hypothetical protein
MTTPRKPAVSTAPKQAAKPATRTVAAKPATRSVAAKPAARTVAPKAAAKPAAKPVKAVVDTTKLYKFLSGVDDSNFCQRVSDHLEAGYELAGSPTMVVKGSTVYVGQAVVRKATKKVVKKKKKK